MKLSTFVRHLISDFWIASLTYSSYAEFFMFARCIELLHYLYKEKIYNLDIEADAFIFSAFIFYLNFISI